MALKEGVKGHGLTCLKIATQLQLVEASVKRFSLSKQFRCIALSKFANLWKWKFLTLCKCWANSNRDSAPKHRAGKKLRESVLLPITVSLLNRSTVLEIIAFYKLSETECIQKLAHTDKLKIIGLLTKNKTFCDIQFWMAWNRSKPIFYSRKNCSKIF